MKSDTRTVLSQAVTNVSSYSSGPLFVGDLHELAIDFTILSATGGSGGFSFTISRIAADGSLQLLQEWYSTSPTPLSIGAGLATNSAFGDQIQIDLYNRGGYTLTANISVLGK